MAYAEEEGDNGKRIENCRRWANKDYKIGTCSLSAEEVIAVLEKEKSFTLATSAHGRVSTRAMSHVNDGLTVYFQTGSDYLKVQQMEANPNVALSVGGYEMEGKVTLLGHPLDTENRLFAEIYKKKHPQYTDIWSTYEKEIVVKVEIGLVRQWRYIDGKPFIAVGQFSQETPAFNAEKFIADVVSQNAEALPVHFAPNAVIRWYETNEELTLPEYVRANCEYPGEWRGALERVMESNNEMSLVYRIASEGMEFLVTAFVKLDNGKIIQLDEYFCVCGTAPQWRQDMKIGKPIVEGKANDTIGW